MNVGLKGALSSIVALGCVASAVPGVLSFAVDEEKGSTEKSEDKASSSSEKSEGEDKKKKEEEDKKKKLETTANALSIASSAGSVLAPSASSASSDAVSRELDLAQRLKTIKLLDEIIKSLEKEKKKSSIEKVSEEVGKTLEYIGDHPFESLVGTFGAAAGVEIFQTARDSGYIGDEVIAAFSPDVIKNINDARASRIKLETSMIDREGKLLDLDAKRRERDFDVNRPGVSNAKRYAEAFGEVLGNISKGIASVFGAFFGGGKK